MVTENITVILNLDLTVTDNGDATLTSNQNGANYQWVDCDNSYALISGETNQTFAPVMNGNYAVIITAGNCSDTSSCSNISTVGVSSVNGSVYKVYPNPNNGLFSIELKATTQVIITNTLGQVVANEMLNAGIQNINIQDKANGIYFVKIVANDSQQIFKIIKE